MGKAKRREATTKRNEKPELQDETSHTEVETPPENTPENTPESTPEKTAETAVSPSAAQAAVQRPPQPGPVEVLGQVSWLMMQSPAHKHLFFADAEWLVLPPVKLRQFRIFRKNNMPIAYASWARLTEEAEARVSAGQIRLKPSDWNAGDRLWLIDLIAPFGGGEEIIKQLRQQVFKDEKVKTLQPAPDGSGMAVVEW